MTSRVGLAVVFFLLLVANLFSQQRKTDDIAYDLLQALVRSERHAEAKWLCETKIAGSSKGGFARARWTCLLAEVLAKQHSSALFSASADDLVEQLDKAIVASVEPINQLRVLGADSSIDVFPDAEVISIRRLLLRSAIIAASVSPPSQQRTTELISRVARLQSDTIDLLDRARDRWSQSTTASDSKLPRDRKVMQSQLKRLVGELVLQRVTIALLQTELFKPATHDFRAAAAECIRLAKDAVLEFPDSAPAKQIARSMLADAYLRSGDQRSAKNLIDQTLATDSSELSSVWLALRVRQLLAEGRFSEARKTCDGFESNLTLTEIAEHQSIEMDFAKLEVLIAGDTSDATVAAWIDTIARRHGEFARRRAQSVAIDWLRESGMSSQDGSHRKVNPSLIAAQGEDLLRRGNAAQASQLLREAALAEKLPDTAFQFALKSAAAAVKAKKQTAAVDVLCDVARRFPQHSTSAQTMLQAAVLLTKPSPGETDPRSRIERLDEILQEITQAWPQTKSASGANRWRCRLLSESGFHQRAALAALEFVTLSENAAHVALVGDYAFEYLSRLDSEDVDQPLSTVTETLLESSTDDPKFWDQVKRVAVWMFDSDDLLRCKGAVAGSDSLNELLGKIESLRKGTATAVDANGVEEKWVQRLRWRLQRDAMLDSGSQSSIGNVLLNWPSDDPWDQIKASYWARQTEASIKAIVDYATKSTVADAILQDAIRVLSQPGNDRSLFAAVELSDRLSARKPVGSVLWYDAKLTGLQLLVRSGKEEQARKRAKYLLLTQPPEDPELRRQLDSIAKP